MLNVDGINLRSEVSATLHMHPLTGDSGVKYNLSALTAGRHSIEVAANCSGVVVTRQQRYFRCKKSLTLAQ